MLCNVTIYVSISWIKNRSNIGDFLHPVEVLPRAQRESGPHRAAYIDLELIAYGYWREFITHTGGAQLHARPLRRIL